MTATPPNKLGRLGPKGRAAVDHLRQGRHVHPLKSESKEPSSTHGFKDATDDLGRVVRWWLRHPDDNIGIATGPSRLLVVDLDVDDGADHCGAAVAALAALADGCGGALPETHEVETPSGGLHWYYRVPDGVEMPRNSASKLAPHVDIRAAGGYVVAAGSTLPAGGYTLVSDLPPAPAPPWLITACGKPEPVVPPAPPVGRPRAASRDTASRWGRKALEGECGRLALAAVGTRNRELYRAAHAIGGIVAAGALDAGDVVAELAMVASRIGLDDHEIRGTLESGLTSGMARPRTVPT